MTMNDDNFHLFRETYLPDPKPCLSNDEYEEVQRLSPLIQEFERHIPERKSQRISTMLSDRYDRAWEKLIQEEAAAWENLGVTRSPDFLVRPSGHLEAEIACHLFNPTFYVESPRAGETDDPSNPTIWELNQNGFTAENSFMFDQVCRREETLDCLFFWQKNVYRPHDDFVREVRQIMGAPIEICWGEDVWKRVVEQFKLVQFPLWGVYKDVKLWLELEDDGSMKRFVFQVHHPQFFCRGLHHPLEEAKVQDLSICLAAHMAGLVIKKDYWETHWLGKHPRLSGQSRVVFAQLRTEAKNELKAAFPARWEELGPKRSKKVQLWRLDMDQLVAELEQQIQNAPEIFQDSNNDDSESAKDDYYQRSRAVSREWVSLSRTILRELTTSPAFGPSHVHGDSLNNSESIEDVGFDWLDLPQPFIDWLQQQDGLRIDRKPMASRTDLEIAFQLLRGKEDPLHCGSYESCYIGDLAWVVGFLYTEKIARMRKSVVIYGTIPGSVGQIVARKCSGCGQRVLDDAFPLFSRKSPEKYITQTLEIRGCGLQSCTQTRITLVPQNPLQAHMRGERKLLDAPTSTRGLSTWTSILCLSAEELEKLDELSTTVQIRCKACKHEQTDSYPRYTREKPSRYVRPRRRCQDCGKRDSYFEPVDLGLKSVDSGLLTRMQAGFKKAGCDLTKTNLPIVPEIIFSTMTYATRVGELEAVQARIDKKE